MRRMFAAAALAVLLAAVPSTGQALTSGVCEVDLPGLCTKQLSVSGTTLTITLTNTSPAGFIVADAFDLPGTTAITSFASTDADFALVPGLGSGGSIDVSPDGTREFVITSTGEYLGGGSPNTGIPVLGSATFTLGLSATVDETAVFLSQLIRVRGAEGVGEGSDKDRVTITPGPGPEIPIPEPGTVLLLGTGMVAGALILRRHRRQ